MNVATLASRELSVIVLLVALACAALLLLVSCIGTRGLSEISSHPYPLIYEDDSSAKFASQQDDVFIEIRKTPVPRPLEHVAVHYASLFPGGEIVKPDDREEYLTIKDKKAYKVSFRTKYIRKRKRLDKSSGRSGPEIPEGWTKAQMRDPVTGEVVPVLHGPVIPQEKVLYLVQGDQYIYYIVLSADGDAVKPAREKFENFVRNDINFH